MAVVGAVAGVTVALAAFHYDGSQPVNVVRLIALLVGLQLVFLLFTLLLIPGRVLGLRRLQDLLATINPGALAVADISPARAPAARARAAVRLARRRARAPDASQSGSFSTGRKSAAVAFNVAALATAIVLVTFTDLAFGWSTTLRRRSRDGHAASCSAIAWPWHAIAPSAVPSSSARRAVAVLSSRGRRRRRRRRVARTRRLVAVHDPCDRDLRPAAAARCCCAIAATFACAQRPTRAVARRPAGDRAARSHGARPRSRRRLPTTTSATLELGACRRRLRNAPITGTARAVIWEGSLRPERRARLRAQRARPRRDGVVEAGGGRALDARPRGARAARGGRRAAFVVFTPAWEPPLLELLDFLAALRRRIGPAASIVVTPVPDEHARRERRRARRPGRARSAASPIRSSTSRRGAP